MPVKTGGAQVKATIFVLKDSISEQEAANILYRRETRQIGSGKAYKPSAKPGPNTVLVATATNVMGVEKVLYTDFPDAGKLVNPRPSNWPGWPSVALPAPMCPRGWTASAIY